MVKMTAGALRARDAKRNLGAELLASVREITGNQLEFRDRDPTKGLQFPCGISSQFSSPTRFTP